MISMSGRAVDGAGLENQYTFFKVSWVRIPPHVIFINLNLVLLK